MLSCNKNFMPTEAENGRSLLYGKSDTSGRFAYHEKPSWNYISLLLVFSKFISFCINVCKKLYIWYFNFYGKLTLEFYFRYSIEHELNPRVNELIWAWFYVLDTLNPYHQHLSVTFVILFTSFLRLKQNNNNNWRQHFNFVWNKFICK